MFRNSLPKLAAAALLMTASVGAYAQSIKAQINFAQPTAGVAVDPLTNQIYVVAPSFGGPTDTLAVIDGKSNKIVKNISIPAGAYLPAVNYLTGRVYVASCDNSTTPINCFISVVDGWHNKYLGKIWLTSTEGDGLLGIDVNLATGRVYVSNASDHIIDVVDGYKNLLVGTLPIASGEPVGLAVNPFKCLLYVPLGNNQVDIFDLIKNTLVSTATVGSTESIAAVNYATGNVFVTDSLAGPSTTEVIDKTGAPVASVLVGDTPYGLAVDPITNLAFVASTSLNNITVIDGKTNTAINTVSNIQADFVALNFATRLVYISGTTGITVLSEK